MARGAPAQPTVAYLERVGLAYLERHGGSSDRLRRVLARRVARAVKELGSDPEEGAAAIDAVVGKLIQLGYLDDARFAAARVRALRRRGKSARAIRAALGGQGVDTLVREALDDGDSGAELTAARAFVRRRRLGPHRPVEQRSAERERDLGRLGRAGFSLGVALRALDEEPEEPE